MNSCIICGHPLEKLSSTERHVIWKCTDCGFGETKNLKAQTGSYHRDETYIEEETLFRNIFQKRVEIISKFKNRGKVLEIGCSTGVMLDLLKEIGWEVVGVEISKSAAKKASDREINVITEPFKKINFKGKFDLVVLNHTLEHLKDPIGVIQKVHSILNNNGLIYIDLPNFGGLSAKINGIKWPMLLPTEHLWHFTLMALKMLLNKSGFKVIFIERASGIWDYGDPFKGLYISLFGFKKRFFVEIFTAIPSWVLTKLQLGSDLMIIAKKI